MIAFIDEYVEISSLRNPYNHSHDISQLVCMLRQNGNVPNISKPKTRNIQSPKKLFRASDSEDSEFAWYYQYKRNSALDDEVPTWDIPLSKLKRIYDQARFDTYLDWVQFVKLAGGSCSKKQIKRRIPWLYAKTGLY